MSNSIQYENHIYENHKRDTLKTIKEIDNKDNKDILYINKSEEINSSESKENNSSKTKRISRMVKKSRPKLTLCDKNHRCTL